ncbi:hypothetical protein EDC96DRAFT_535637, partial [Choanephora cucurbitarum]
MILVFSIIVSLFPGSGVSYYGLSFSLFLSLSLSLSSLCSGALVFLWFGLFV